MNPFGRDHETAFNSRTKLEQRRQGRHWNDRRTDMSCQLYSYFIITIAGGQTLGSHTLADKNFNLTIPSHSKSELTGLGV